MRLDPLPEGYTRARDALHQLAFFALAPARYRAVGRMGLRHTPGGFGTPEFDGSVARVEGNLLVYEKGGNVATRTISTIRDAAAFFDVEYQVDWFTDFKDPLSPADLDQPLTIDEASALALGQWFEFAFDVLNQFRARGDDATEVQLWPEHFDAATDLGDAARGGRASYGLSPGDSAHDQPYVYVAAWDAVDRAEPYWGDSAFNGASLGYEALLDSAEPGAIALEFLDTGRRMLQGG